MFIFSQTSIYDSGGPLLPEQACFDVIHYDLDLHVSPSDSSINGKVQVRAKMVVPADEIALNLDTLLKVRSVKLASQTPLPFTHFAGYIYIQLDRVYQPGEVILLEIPYGGKPRIAPRPPWEGGFTWAYTSEGSPWIATSCQTIGADVWWPCKDHVSDKPDSMDLHIRVPDPLVVASNGRLREIQQHQDGTSTYHWHSSQPISVYNVALNIAPYKLISDSVKSVAGDIYPVDFYVLPEDHEQGKKLFPEIIEHLKFYEKYLGPYPFRADKYGVAQTPHLGMEHQTIIAYGANFDNSSMTGIDWGYDALHHHELGHEWWGNLVTCSDWRDMWIHEGFCSYMQGLYQEELEGPVGLKKYMARNKFFGNTLAIAPKAVRSTKQIYRAPIYNKGAWVLHSLRGLVGDSTFFQLLRRMTYPNPEWEKTTDGTQVRFVSTQEFIRLAESLSGKELEWFFDVYARQPRLPELEVYRIGDQLEIAWKSPESLPFPMPIEIEIGERRILLDMKDQRERVNVPIGEEVRIDPDFKVLFQGNGDQDFRIKQQYE